MVISRAMSSVEKQMVLKRLEVLNAGCSSGSKGELAKAVLEMLVGTGGTGDDPKSVITAYVKMLEDLPLFAVKRACLRFGRGEVTASELGLKELNTSFRPSTAQVAQVARAIAKPFTDEQIAAGRLLRSSVRPPEPSQEAKDRIAAQFKQLSNTLKANSAKVMGTDTTAVARRNKEMADRTQLMLYEQAGLEPVWADEDRTMVVSLPLLLSQGWTIVQHHNGRSVLVAPGHDADRMVD